MFGRRREWTLRPRVAQVGGAEAGMHRHETSVDGDTVYVETPAGRLLIGDLDPIVEIVGGHAWTIEYSAWQHEHYDDLDTTDEGLTVDVIDVMEAMTHDDSFVETLRAHPVEPAAEVEASLSPRLGLFVGKLLENLQSGLD
jgi:hypothetical protein